MAMRAYVQAADIKIINSQADQYDENQWPEDVWVMLHSGISGYITKAEIVQEIFG